LLFFLNFTNTCAIQKYTRARWRTSVAILEMNLRISLFLVSLLLAGDAFAQGSKKLDPCAGAQSQAEMTICWGKKYKAADAKLNEVYRRLVSMLDEEQKSQLKEAQTAWLKYRDTHCEFVADEYKGGSMRPMIYAICLEEVTRNRTSELRGQIKERTY
jgi:uncharacterized protein YecT (DUF1311 family)